MSFVTTSDQVPEWAAHCPADWRRDWLKWSVECHVQRPSEEQAAELPYISNEDIASWTGELLRDDPQPSESEGRVFQRDDALFNKLRPYLAKVYHAEFDGISSGELLCLRSGATVLPRFLFYVLVSKGFIDTVDAESFGTKMPRADWGIVGHQPLPLPPLETQHRIVRFLDAKTALIDALTAKKRALLERLAEKRQALITQAVTKGLDPNVPMKDSGIDWLGRIPAHWDLKRLRFLIEGGTRNGLYKPKESFSEDGVPFVQMGEAYRGPVFVGGTADRVIANETEVEKWSLRRGDFLIARRSLVFDGSGKSVMVGGLKEDHLFESSMIRLRPVQSSCPSEFLSYYFQSSLGRALILSITKQVTISGIDSQQLKDFPVAFPSSVAECLVVATFCQERDSATCEADTKIATSVARLQEYRASLVTAAVTGQLEIPADEPAESPKAHLGKLATEVA